MIFYILSDKNDLDINDLQQLSVANIGKTKVFGLSSTLNRFFIVDEKKLAALKIELKSALQNCGSW